MKNIFGIILLFVLLTVLQISADAQRPAPSLARRIDEINRQAEKVERDRMEREKEKENAPNIENSKRTKLIKAQIKEDFENIQVIYNHIVINLQSDSELDRAFILKSSADIKKHAARLKKNLSLPEPEESKKEAVNEENTADMRKSLLTLCQYIYDFVTNPIFNQPIGLDLAQSVKARRDLEMILNLSQQINKSLTD